MNFRVPIERPSPSPSSGGDSHIALGGNLLDRSREDSKDEHMHLISDAVLESVMVFRLAAGAGAMAEVVYIIYILNEIWVFTLTVLYFNFIIL